MNSQLPTIRSSALANYCGQGWSALIGIAFLPLYLRVLGLENYALIGVFAVLQAWMAVLDLGLTPTLNREMARLRAGAHSARSIRNLLRSLEIVCGTLTILTIASLWMAAPWLTAHWLKLQGLSASTVANSIRLMAFVLAIRFFEQIYRGALQGIQDQNWLNSVSALLATLRWGGAYLVITLFTPTVSAFFLWQGCISLLTTAVLVNRTYHLLPRCESRGTFDRAALVNVYGFARGMFVGSLLAFLLTQSDKLAVSKMLPLGELGYYMLAATIAGGLMQLVVPLNATIFPRLTMQVANGDETALRRTYDDACQWMAAIVIPPALVLSFFPDTVLFAWSGDREVAARVAPLLRILALGQLANALVNMPYMLQLANGWTSLAIRINAVAVMLFIPLVLWLIPHFGSAGAASAWLGLNLSYMAITASLMHRRLLPDAKRGWYRNAVAIPLVAGGSLALLARIALPNGLSRMACALSASGCGLVIFLGTTAAIPAVRSWAIATSMSLRLSLSGWNGKS